MAFKQLDETNPPPHEREPDGPKSSEERAAEMLAKADGAEITEDQRARFAEADRSFRQIKDPRPDAGPQPPPPDLPEVFALRKHFELARLAQASILETFLKLRSAHQLDRFEDEIAALYASSRVLLWQMHLAYGSSYAPPEFPKQRQAEPIQ